MQTLADNLDTIEKLIKAEKQYESADILISYRKYIDFQGLADLDEFLGSLRRQKAESGSIILELRQELGLDTSMFDNEEFAIDD